jgi:regulator of protease activity HflC (stomatin/prohibitin superfamily)
MTELSIVIIFLVIIAIVKGVRIVPQGEEWVVERLGKFTGHYPRTACHQSDFK